MKRIIIAVLSIIAMILSGCGGDDNTKNNDLSADAATIMTKEDARKAVGFLQSTRLDILANGMSQSLAGQLGVHVTKNRVAFPLPYVKERTCAISGTVSSVGEKIDFITYDVNNTYHECMHLDGIVVNGTQKVNATLENNKLYAVMSDNNITLSKGDTVMRLNRDYYSDPIKLYADRNFQKVEIISSMTRWIKESGATSVSEVILLDFNTTIDSSIKKMYLNGDTNIEACGEITAYSIQTIVPVTMGVNGTFTSGKLVINGAAFEFNTNNTVSITLKNGDTYTLKQEIGVICGLNPNALEFIRNDAKEVVIDNNRLLMWQDDSAAATVTKPWLTQEHYDDYELWFDTSGDTATTYCAELTLGGYNDWELPSLGALISIMDHEKFYSPTISAVFQNTASNAYWSSDVGGASGSAAVLDFQHASLDDDIKISSNNVRCVREMSDLNPPVVITILGDNPLTISQGSNYIDAGAIAKDGNSEDITMNLDINNSVNTAKVGVYTVTYSISDTAGHTQTVIRVVNVI